MSASETVQTIADIARMAGVSKSTVSRALDDSPLIGAETKERIRAIARDHNFQRNAPARNLSLRQSHAIALATQPHKGAGDGAVPDAFMLELMSGVTAALHQSDYDLLVVSFDHGDVEWSRRYYEGGRADGFIVLTAMCSPAQLGRLVETKTPFVAWGEAPSDHRYCTVSGDSVAGGRVATEHLLETGRRRIGFLGGPGKASEVAQRRAGYEAALREAGLPVDPGLAVAMPWHPAERSGAEGIGLLLEAAPDLDAVFAVSDAMALAAMDALRDAGRRVPEDVAVVGYDDIAVARHANPPLTTIRQNGPLAGRLLAQNLLEYLRSGVVTNVTIPADLVVRSST
jgi:DNA-binding LacI/PurR family transcriptional regulator